MEQNRSNCGMQCGMLYSWPQFPFQVKKTCSFGTVVSGNWNHVGLDYNSNKEFFPYCTAMTWVHPKHTKDRSYLKTSLVAIFVIPDQMCDKIRLGKQTDIMKT